MILYKTNTTVKDFEKILEHDASAILTILVAFTSNLLDELNQVDFSGWFTFGSFLLAAVIGVFKIKSYYYESKIKKIQYEKLEKEQDETK